MMGAATLLQTSLPDLKLERRGKVRDVYGVDDEHLLIVATDRISAFDCVLPTPIRRKGEVLIALSRFWFEMLRHVVPNHLVTTDLERMPDVVRRHSADLNGRSMLVRRAEVFPVECVVRGYLSVLDGRIIYEPEKFAVINSLQTCRSQQNCPSPFSLRQRRLKRVTMKTSVRRRFAICSARRPLYFCAIPHLDFTRKLESMLVVAE